MRKTRMHQPSEARRGGRAVSKAIHLCGIPLSTRSRPLFLCSDRVSARRKRAQLQIGESIAVLFIFMLMVGFGLFFYFRASLAGYNEKLASDQSMDIVRITLAAQSLPELQCTSRLSIRNCVDLQAMQALADEIYGPGQTPASITAGGKELRDFYYNDIFLTSRIEAIITHDGMVDPTIDTDKYADDGLGITFEASPPPAAYPTKPFIIYDKTILDSLHPNTYVEIVPVVFNNPTRMDHGASRGELYFGLLRITYTAPRI